MLNIRPEPVQVEWLMATATSKVLVHGGGAARSRPYLIFVIAVAQPVCWCAKTVVGPARKNVRDRIISTTCIVTAFTLAHSLTLMATALDWVHFASRWVDVGIAASVAIAALNHLYPIVIRLGGMTFAFGLLHGMGSAGVLGERGLPADQKVLTVLSFNIGVELCQLVVVGAVLPLLILVAAVSGIHVAFCPELPLRLRWSRCFGYLKWLGELLSAEPVSLRLASGFLDYGSVRSVSAHPEKRTPVQYESTCNGRAASAR